VCVLFFVCGPYAGRIKFVCGPYVARGPPFGDPWCRVLLDSGSQNNFISESLVQSLKLRREKVSYDITGIGQTVQTIKSAVTIKIKSRLTDYEEMISYLVLPHITNYVPVRAIDTSKFKIPENVALADNEFNEPQRIDILIGAELFYNLFNNGQIKLIDEGPTLKETKFGWIISGRF